MTAPLQPGAAVGVLCAIVATVLPAQPSRTLFGVKSCGSSPGVCIVIPSTVPTQLFSFDTQTSVLADLGTVTENGAPILVDGLAFSPAHGLLAFQLDYLVPSGIVTGSKLVRLDPATASATAIGATMPRAVRGATFDVLGALWVLDDLADELLRIDPASGNELAGAVAVTDAAGAPLDLGTGCDLAVGADGRAYVTIADRIHLLFLATGSTSLVHAGSGRYLPGATFVPGAAADALFALDVNLDDDLLRYDLAQSPVAETTVAANILPRFNAGRGDLASEAPPVLATCTFRNGSGMNAAGYVCVTRPALGARWQTTVPVGSGTLGTIVAIAVTPSAGVLWQGGELLIGFTPLPLIDTALGAHSIPIPGMPSLLGLRLSSQGVRLDAGAAGQALVFFNAQDLFFGL